jgi:hypothetical protein
MAVWKAMALSESDPLVSTQLSAPAGSRTPTLGEISLLRDLYLREGNSNGL